MAGSASGDPHPARDGAFARLVTELEELGFEPARPVGHRQDAVYPATDSAVAIATVADASDPHVYVTLAARRGHRVADALERRHAGRGPADRLVRRGQRRSGRRPAGGRGGIRRAVTDPSRETFPHRRLRRRGRHAGAPDTAPGVVGRPRIPWPARLFTPLLADTARFTRHSPGERRFVDETYVRIGGLWRYVYRAVDQYGQVIDVLVSPRRDARAARRFLQQALNTLKMIPVEVVTDASAGYPAVLGDLLSAAWHHVERCENNRVESDHAQLKHRLRPMRGLRADRSAQVIIAGQAFVQNLRRGRYELAVDAPAMLRVSLAFTEPATAI
jgi:IS6 family transposase